MMLVDILICSLYLCQTVYLGPSECFAYKYYFWKGLNLITSGHGVFGARDSFQSPSSSIYDQSPFLPDYTARANWHKLRSTWVDGASYYADATSSCYVHTYHNYHVNDNWLLFTIQSHYQQLVYIALIPHSKEIVIEQCWIRECMHSMCSWYNI